jgi:polyhydroxybutyrate depolymerase
VITARLPDRRAAGETAACPTGSFALRAAAIAFSLAVLAAPSPARAADPCPPADPCRVASGAYALALPRGWDGRTALPLVVFFHGFGDSPAGVLARTDMMRLVEEQRVILAVPQGLEARWHVRPGGPRPRDDLAFAASVAEDVMARHRVDPAMVVASGFSAGAFLTWTLACERPGRFTGFLPVAGGLWHPVREGPCPGGPVAIRHVHGRDDHTVPLAGRTLSGGARQGDIRASLAAALVTNHCAPVPEVGERGAETCTTWRACRGGALTFCTHAGGHDMDARWIAEGLAWLRALPRAAR